MTLYIYISFSLIINIIHLPFAHLPKYALFPPPPQKEFLHKRNFGEQTRYIMVDVQMADGSIHMIRIHMKNNYGDTCIIVL